MPRSQAFVALTLVLAMGVQAAGQGRPGGRGATSASLPAPASASTGTPVTLPGTQSAAFATIHVSAVSTTNTALPGWMVRLRDARMGRMLAAHTTDEQGTHTFRDIDPGSYIIELVGGDQSIQATSALLGADAGAVVYAVVRLPTRPEGLAAFFSNGVALATAIAAAAAAAAGITEAADAAGVAAVQSTTDVSPR